MSKHKPFLHATTLWDFPSQNYGDSKQGDINYVGATPSYIIWNVLQKYTQLGDVVVDPFCGSGTTLDVSKELGRVSHGFDINPSRPDIKKSDAREIPLPPSSVDLVFTDPPYGDHIHYSEEEGCIGKISPYHPQFSKALGQVYDEIFRILKPGGVFALYICDFYTTKKGFVPIGFQSFEHISKKMIPIDIISVTRHNADLDKGNYRKAAVEQNFYLRGFNYLFLFEKPGGKISTSKPGISLEIQKGNSNQKKPDLRRPDQKKKKSFASKKGFISANPRRQDFKGSKRKEGA